MKQYFISHLREARRISALLCVFVLLFNTVPFSSSADTADDPRVLAGHVHTDACYTKELICGLEEEPDETRTVRTFHADFRVHRHSSACYNGSNELACGLAEGEYCHTHNEFCRDENGKLVCGLEARKPHEHTDACYKTEKVLICDNQDPGHTHDESCIKRTQVLTCTLPEEEGHTHTDACYTETRTLVCTLPEEPGHLHTDACRDEEGNLICGLEETEGHTHGDACYKTERILTCGLEEKPGHKHSENCYETKTEYTCGQEEHPAHVHTDACYQEEKTLICDKPTSRHRHTEKCYDANHHVTCGKVEVPVFECTADNWTEETVVIREGHKHTDACYETKLTCTIPEGQPEQETAETPAETKEPVETEVPDETEAPATEQSATEATEKLTEEPTESPAPEQETEEPATEITEAPEELPTEEPSEATTEEPIEEPTEEPSEDSAEETTEEPTEEPAEATIEETTGEPTASPVTLYADEKSPVQVSVTFTADAGLPEDTCLVVTEAGTEDTQEASEMTPLRSVKSAEVKSGAGAKRMTKAADTKGLLLDAATEGTEELPMANVPLTEWQAGEQEPEIRLYHRKLDLTLVSAGEEVEPNPETQVTVSVTLPDLEEGLDVRVLHEKNDGTVVPVESTTSGQTVTFTTDSFSLFDFTSTAQKLSSWTSNLLENTFFGKTDAQEAAHEEIFVDNVTEGLTVLEAFTVTKSSDLWMTLQRIKDLVLGRLESIVLYTVEDGKLGTIVKENITLTDVLRFSLSDLSSFALVKDTGLRRKVAEMGNVILNGMMPKNAEPFW